MFRQSILLQRATSKPDEYAGESVSGAQIARVLTLHACIPQVVLELLKATHPLAFNKDLRNRRNA